VEEEEEDDDMLDDDTAAATELLLAFAPDTTNRAKTRNLGSLNQIEYMTNVATV
jgi:hypothetical protein